MRSGIGIAAGIDVGPDCRYPFASNNSAQFIERNVSTLAPEEITPFFQGADVTPLAD